MTDFYVFNIGLNRAGTTSLCTSLNMLGIPSLHYANKDRSKSLTKIMEKNLKIGRKLLDPIDSEFKGFTDFDGERFYKILFNQYPNSKYILTIRNKNDWVNSKVKHSKYRYFTKDFKRLTYDENVDYFEQQYATVTNDIRQFFSDKPGMLLELDICAGDGWEKLCKFLNLSIPTVPFPYLNKSVDRTKF